MMNAKVFVAYFIAFSRRERLPGSSEMTFLKTLEATKMLVNIVSLRRGNS